MLEKTENYILLCEAATANLSKEQDSDVIQTLEYQT